MLQINMLQNAIHLRMATEMCNAWNNKKDLTEWLLCSISDSKEI